MTNLAQEMTIEGFLDLVKRRHELQHTIPHAPIANGSGTGGNSADNDVPNYSPLFDRPFCFLLGAGASVSSGIPSGAALARQWLEEMHLREDTDRSSLEKWATPEHLGHDNFEEFTLDRYAEFYPQLFERYFRGNAEYANAYLQDVMRGAIPGFGYSILAWILARTRHHLVISTNFDNLVADSLFQYARISPLVIGHESLARFVRLEPGRPLVCKLHRDLFFDPMNDVDSVSYLKTEWAEALHTLLKRYTPIVIGYGGNDGSLMNFLEHLPTLGPDGIFWTFWYRDPTRVSKRVEKVVRKHQGWLVRIYGFDEVMAQFAEVFGVPNLTSELIKAAEETSERYKEASKDFIDQAATVLAEQATGIERKRLYRAAMYHAEQSDVKNHWHYWEIQARAAETDDDREYAYERGIEQLEDCAGLLSNFAWFLWSTRNQKDRAEEYYKRAVEADPKEFCRRYGNFLVQARGDLKGAAAVYERGIEADPKNAYNLCWYALFLQQYIRDFDKAEVYYKRAAEADVNNAITLGNYARFLEVVRQRSDAAEDHYKRAIKADRKNAINLGNYAHFLEAVKKDPSGAEDYYKLAIITDPHDATNLGNYARFLEIRKDYDGAAEHYRQAIEADPQNATNLVSYARFLEFARQNYDGAEGFYKRAIEADSGSPYSAGEYARFLELVRKDYDGAEDYYKRAIEIGPDNADNLGNYALFLAKHRDDPKTVKKLAKRVDEISPGDERMKVLVQATREPDRRKAGGKSVSRVAKPRTAKGAAAEKLSSRSAL